MTMNSTTSAHQTVRPVQALSYAVVVAALMVSSATARADVCNDFLAALAMQDTALQALTQHSRQKRRSKTVNKTGESFIGTYITTGDTVDESARAVAQAIRGEAAAVIDALHTLTEAHKAVSRAVVAWHKALPVSGQRDMSGLVATLAESGGMTYEAYIESLKIACQN